MRSILMILAMTAASACATPGAGGPAAAGDVSPIRGEPAFVVSNIEGKTGADLDALLGAPDLKRVEGQGEFRRYMLADCALLVILYPDEKGAVRATTVDASALKSGEEKPDLDRCLARGRAEKES